MSLRLDRVKTKTIELGVQDYGDLETVYQRVDTKKGYVGRTKTKYVETTQSTMPKKYPELYRQVLAAMIEAEIREDQLERAYFQQLLAVITKFIREVKNKEETKENAMKQFDEITTPVLVQCLEQNKYEKVVADKFIELLKPILNKWWKA